MNWRLELEFELPREGEAPPEVWRDLPEPAMAGVSGPEDYLPHQALLDAVNTALLLGQPLLVTGDPGCGKTELGDFVSYRLGLGPKALRYQAKSDMQARDLFYTFDTVARFHAAQSKQDVGPVRFIHYHALGEAIIQATEPGLYSAQLPEDYVHLEKRRSVVLIDEIDKAPRDVPNDLLGELEQMNFRIPELENAVIAADRALRPIVILTSNSEKALPDAFLRRCVYYHIPFPEPATLREIISTRLEDLPKEADLVGDAITLMTHLRDRRNLRKKPGTAELLGFLLALKDDGFGPSDRLADDTRWHQAAVLMLLKSRDDQESFAGHFEDIEWSAAEAA